jgi:chorismate-pyruvate lyase
MNTARAVRSTIVGLLLATAANNVANAAGPRWPNNFATRLEALALLQTLNADLLSHDSATLILERWCGAHRIAPAAHITAVQKRIDPKPLTAEQRQTLRVAPTDPVHYRHVQLLCGSVVLSEADNWYVPGRLTREMNRLLETTETPFGAVVRDLHFQRHIISARLLWNPLPPGWEMGSTAIEQPTEPLTVPAEVLEHRAVLSLPDGAPISEVVETYTGNVLAFPVPQLADAPADVAAGAGQR